MAKKKAGPKFPLKKMWKLKDKQWMAERERQWPFIERAFAKFKIDGLKEYFLEANILPAAEKPIKDLDFISRLALVPWMTEKDMEKIHKAYAHVKERFDLEKIREPVLFCGIAQKLGLPMERYNDAGIVMQEKLAEVFFSFSALIPEEAKDESHDPDVDEPSNVYREFIRLYEKHAVQLLNGVTPADDGLFLNPSKEILSCYFRCYKTYENDFWKVFIDDEDKQQTDTFLDLVLHFSDHYPEVDNDSVQKHFAHLVRIHLDRHHAPTTLKKRVEKLSKDELEPIPIEKFKEEFFPNLKFYRDSLYEYEQGGSPDTEIYVGLAIEMTDTKSRDLLLRLLGTVGRELAGEKLDKADRAMFEIVDQINAPAKARGIGDTGAHFEWWDWDSYYIDLQPLRDLVAQLDSKLAFVFSTMQYDGTNSEVFVLDGQDWHPTKNHTSTLFKVAKKIFYDEPT